MTKILVSPLNKEMIYDIKDYVDGYIVGLDKFCVNFNTFSLDDTLDIINYCNSNKKEIYICLNKNIHNNEIDNLKEILVKFNNINGLLFYDNGTINLKEKLDLKYDLIISSEHQVLNYQTINYYREYNINSVLISSDITLREVFEIKENTKSKIILPVLGYLPMFVSHRHLVKNYLNKFNLKDNSKINYMEKEGKIYPLIDNEIGTMVYSSDIYNILDELDNIGKNNIDYILLNSFLIDNFSEIVKKVYNKDIKNIDKLIGKTSTYFKDLETVYKVK